MYTSIYVQYLVLKKKLIWSAVYLSDCESHCLFMSLLVCLKVTSFYVSLSVCCFVCMYLYLFTVNYLD